MVRDHQTDRNPAIATKFLCTNCRSDRLKLDDQKLPRCRVSGWAMKWQGDRLVDRIDVYAAGRKPKRKKRRCRFARKGASR